MESSHTHMDLVTTRPTWPRGAVLVKSNENILWSKKLWKSTKLKLWQTSKTQNMTKLKIWNYDKTKKNNSYLNSKAHIVTNLQPKILARLKITQTVKSKNLNLYKTLRTFKSIGGKSKISYTIIVTKLQ